eukprot:185032-Pyramimonas_sp.AAC.1
MDGVCNRVMGSYGRSPRNGVLARYRITRTQQSRCSRCWNPKNGTLVIFRIARAQQACCFAAGESQERCSGTSEDFQTVVF